MIYKGMQKLNKISQKFFLVMNHKLLSEISLLSNAEIYLFIQTLGKMSNNNNKLINSLHILFISKIDEFSLIWCLHILLTLLDAKKCKVDILRDTVLIVLRKVENQFSKLNLEELTTFLYIYFGNIFDEI
jgi:hypothetical protein